MIQSLYRLTLVAGIMAAAPMAHAVLTWTTVSSPVTQNLWGVCAGDGLFVSVGEAGTILTSPDGTTWSARASGTTEWLVGVAYGARQYVVVGEHGTILTSSDAITWTPHSIGGVRLNNIAYGDGRFVAIGQNGTVATSLDAIHWTIQLVPVNGWLRAITFSRGRFVIGGQSGVLFSTEDGSRFHFISSFGNAIEALADNGSVAYFCGDQLVMRAVGGNKWEAALPSSYNFETGYYRGATCYGETLLAVGEAGIVSVMTVGLIPSPAYSTGDISFQSSQNLNAVTSSHVAVIAVGNAGTILRCADSAKAPTLVSGGGGDLSPYSGRAAVLQISEPRGGPPSSYEWRLNGKPISSSNSPYLRLPGVTSLDLGTYTLKASNPLGAVTRTYQITSLTSPPSEAVDPAFVPQISDVKAENAVLLPDSRLLVLANSGTPRHQSLQRFYSDGSWDLSFHADAVCDKFIMLADQSFIIYGTRNLSNSEIAIGAWHLDRDGKLDRTVSVDSNLRIPVALANGQFLLIFASGNHITLTRWNSDGSADPQYPAVTLFSQTSEMVCATTDDRDRIYLAASTLNSSGGATLFRLLADGTPDGSFVAATISDSIERLWWRRGKLCFDTGLRRSMSTHEPLPSQPRAFAKLTENGESDPTFTRVTGGADSDGISLIGGFDLEGGLIVTRHGLPGLIRYDQFGVRDNGFAVNLDQLPSSIGVMGDGTLLVSGSFNSLNGVPTTGLARLLIGTHDPKTHLANLSIRTTAGSGDQTLIAGFIVSGSAGSRSVLLRGVGPGLVPLGISAREALTDPQLKLFNGQAVIATNDDWNPLLEPMANVLGAYPLTPGSKDAALFSTLHPGLYTTHATNGTGEAGIALIELYDADSAPVRTADARLANLSGRAHVGTGDNVLIAGFVLSGNSTKRLLIRAIGPGLRPLGVTEVLPDPELIVHRNGMVVASNDDWNSSDTTVFTSVGAFSLASGSNDAALVLYLSPGVYTAMVHGVGATTGTALIEVYEVP